LLALYARSASHFPGFFDDMQPLNLPTVIPFAPKHPPRLFQGVRHGFRPTQG
jgi:hypothetical protein